MKKRTDAQLFRELRITNFIFWLAMIIVFIAGFFMKDLGEYLQEHPKVIGIVMLILIILALLGLVIFFMFTRSIG